MLWSPSRCMGTTLMPGRVHGHDEHGDALVLGRVGVGAGGQPDVVGAPGQRGVDLLSVDDVLVAVPHRPGLQRGQVGARLGLGVADAEVDVAGQDLGEEEVLLLLGPEVHDGRADRVDGQHGHRGPGPHGLVEEDVLLDGPRPWPPYSLGHPMPSHPSAAICLTTRRMWGPIPWLSASWASTSGVSRAA